MGRVLAWTVAAAVAAGAAETAAAPDVSVDIATLLARVGERVEHYLTRAQSLICIETVKLQPLDFGMAPDQTGRTVESELRVSWAPLADRRGALPEAQFERQVMRINGGRPRKNDPRNCTTPEQNATETQPLSMLLPEQQPQYIFSLGGTAKLDDRTAILLDFEHKVPATVKVSEIENNEDCVGFNVDGGVRGRVWIDTDTFDVLRLDQRLRTLVEIPLPRRTARRSNGPDYWTVDRMDISMRFKTFAFQDPEESLVLPVSVSMLTVTRGSATPRLRTTTSYSQYRRFITGARLVQQ
jgi:hypothetical protein